jgi:hypothetical protein
MGRRHVDNGRRMQEHGSPGHVGRPADGRLTGVAAPLTLRAVEGGRQRTAGQLLPVTDDSNAGRRVAHVVAVVGGDDAVVRTAGGTPQSAARARLKKIN